MSRFADLVVKQDRSEEEDQELHVLAQQLDYVVADLGTVIGPSGVVSYLRAGCVVLDNAGMHTFLGGVETGRIEADGDFLLGSNIASAATTSFAVFTNDQTYNSESIGAGDVLMGDNSSSKANILWDVSTGQLLFRGGTTTQGYIDTDGAAYFGGGDVRLGVGGMVLQTGQAATNQILWEDRDAADGTNYGALYAYHIGTTPNKCGYMVLNSGAEVGGNASAILALQAYDANINRTGLLRLTGSESLSYIAQTTTTNNIPNMVSFERTMSGNAEDGFGFNFGFILDDDSSTKQFAGIIQTKWSDVSEAMRQMTFFMPDTNVPFLRFDMLTASTYEAIINDAGLDMDFRIESSGNANAIMVDGGLNAVGIMGVGVDGTALTVYTGAAAAIGLLVKGAASQSANLQEWRDSAGNVLAGVDERGILFSDGDTDVTNVFIGGNAGKIGSTGTGNVGLGFAVLDALTDGSNNMAIGSSSLSDLTSGEGNVAIGFSSLRLLSTGSKNTAIGFLSGFNVTGSSNVFIGHDAGYRQTAVSNILLIDNQLRGSAAVELTNAIIYGVMAAVPANQTLRINASVGIGTTPASKLQVAGAVSSATLVLSAAGPTDNLDVSGVNTIFIDTSNNNVTLGGTVGGVDGQSLFIVVDDATNNFTLEHNEGINQSFILHAGSDEVMTAEHGGWIFVNHGGNHWHDASHAKHV